VSKILLLNKPYGVLCQFTDKEGRPTLADYITEKDVYAAGRLDADSEGLVVLTDDGKLQHRISDPKHKTEKAYRVQVEGEIDDAALERLRNGVELRDGITRKALASRIDEPVALWPREPPIRDRKHIPTCWIELVIREGRNRQVRRMTAAVGFPTLRLIRFRVGDWTIEGIKSGDYISIAATRAI
jgi:23S rRNA pseudouridine2457 synthase